MAEAPLTGPLGVVHQQLLVLEHLERLLVGLGDQRELGHVEGGAREHGGRPDEVPGRGRKVVDPRGDDGLDGGGQQPLGERVRVRGEVVIGVPEHPRGLHDEERVAARVAGDPFRRRQVQVLAGLLRELRRVVEGHRLEVQGERVPQPAGPLGTVVEEVVARDAQHEQRDVLGVAHDLLDQVEHRGLGLVGVLEHQDDRRAGGQAGEDREQPGPDLGHRVAALLAARVLVPDPEGEREPCHRLLDLVGGAAGRRELLQPREQPGRAGVRALPQLLEQHLRERPERDLLLERARPAEQHLHLVGQPREELLGHAALADPRLAEQGDQVAPARLEDALERVVEQPELALAVDDRDRAARAAGREGDHRPASRVVVEPLRVDDPRRLVLDLRAREEPGPLGHLHGPGVGALLQARGEVDRRAEEQALLRGLGADGDRPGVDAHPRPERDREPVALADPLDPLDEGEAGPHGAQRVVVVDLGDAEDADDRVAGEVVRAAPERLELLGHGPVEGRDDLAVALGVDLRRELRRADEVDEDDRDDLALLGRGGLDRVGAVRAEPSALGEGLAAALARRSGHAGQDTQPR